MAGDIAFSLLQSEINSTYEVFYVPFSALLTVKMERTENQTSLCHPPFQDLFRDISFSAVDIYIFVYIAVGYIAADIYISRYKR